MRLFKLVSIILLWTTLNSWGNWRWYVSINEGALHYVSKSAPGTYVYIDWALIKDAWTTYSSNSSSVGYPSHFTMNGKYYSCTTSSTYNFGTLEQGKSFTVVVPAPGIKDGTLAVQWKIIYKFLGKTFNTSTKAGTISYLAYGSAEKGSVTLTVNPWEVVPNIPEDNWNYLYFGVRKGDKATEGHIGYFRFGKSAEPLTFKAEPTDFTYNGQKQGPTVTAYDSKGNLVGPENYVVEGDATAVEIGSYTLSATATGNYTGSSGDIPWQIHAPDVSFSLSPESYVYDGTPKTVAIVPSVTDATYTSSGPLTATNPGTYVVVASATGDYSGSTVMSWTIKPAPLGTLSARAIPASEYLIWFNPSSLASRQCNINP
jgi:hypothetical protein